MSKMCTYVLRAIFCLTVTVASIRPVPAQDVAKPYQFSEQGHAAIQRLGTLSSIASRDWQYHEGAVPDGESLALNTSDWKTVHIPFVAPPGQEIWLRRWIEIPKTLNGYDLTGASITFQIDVGGDGAGRGYLYETIYFNGKRIVEGTHLGRQVLLESAKQGDRVLIAVEMPANLQSKHFQRASVQVQFLKSRPDPEVVRAELISAAMLLPVISQDATELASREKTLDAAASAINVSALDQGDQQAFDASLKEAQAHLESLRPVLKSYFVQMTGNAHIDAEWLWTWT